MGRTEKLWIGLGIGSVFLGLSGCSTGAAPTDSISVSSQDLKSSTVFKAKQLLDGLEKMSPEVRDMSVSHNMVMAGALKAAVAIDPATKQRVDSLGIHLK